MGTAISREHSYLKVYLQEREEDNSFNTQKLPNRLHGFQLSLVGLVEEHQAVHGDELREIVDRYHVGEGHVGAEVALAVHAAQVAHHRYHSRQRPHQRVLEDAVLAVVNEFAETKSNTYCSHFEIAVSNRWRHQSFSSRFRSF